MTTKNETTAPEPRCEFCEAGMKPVKLKRQYVHHLRRLGRVVVCQRHILKPAAA
jgi:hypothetical protein